MNNIQKMIKELKALKFRAKKESLFWKKRGDNIMWAMFIGQIKALNFCIIELTLLLNTERRKNGEKRKQK